MKLTKKLGLNQYIWSDLKQVLPLLSKKRFYRHLKYGYARGAEPVKYVESIYSFRNILENNFKEIDKDKE
jgi:membrane-bound lytic murein transglycosylase F